MSNTIILIIENASFIAIFLFCILGILACYKYNKTLPGADLLLLGFLFYAIYGMMGWAVPKFNGSLMTDWTRTAVLGTKTMPYFLTWAMRLGLILIFAGIFRIGKGLKNKSQS